MSARCADQHVCGSIRPIQPEQRQSCGVEERAGAIEVVSPAVRASHFLPSDLVMLCIVTDIRALELFEESHKSPVAFVVPTNHECGVRSNWETTCPRVREVVIERLRCRLTGRCETPKYRKRETHSRLSSIVEDSTIRRLLADEVLLGRSEPPDGGQVQCTPGEQLQDGWPLSRRPCRLDPQISSMFRKMKHLSAVGEERRAALAQIQASCIELSERGNQLGGGVSLGCGESLDLVDEFGVREPPVCCVFVVHAPL